MPQSQHEMPRCHRHRAVAGYKILHFTNAQFRMTCPGSINTKWVGYQIPKFTKRKMVTNLHQIQNLSKHKNSNKLNIKTSPTSNGGLLDVKS